MISPRRKKLQDIPAPSWLADDVQAFWPSLMNFLADKELTDSRLLTAALVLADSLTAEEHYLRDCREAGASDLENFIGPSVKNAAELLGLEYSDLDPLREIVPPRFRSEHHKWAWELRRELRQNEVLIRQSVSESPEWVRLLDVQRRLHSSLMTASLLAEIHDDREAELKRLAEDDCEGEEWKGADQ